MALPQRFRTCRALDAWVVSHLVLSCLAVTVAARHTGSVAATAITCYGLIRILEIVVHHMSAIFVLPEHRTIQVDHIAHADYRQVIALALSNYAELILWFAAIELNCRSWFTAGSSVLSTAIGGVYFSLSTMLTLGYGDATPVNDWGRLVVSMQLAIGALMTFVILARFVSSLPSPTEVYRIEKRDPLA
jgi:hypothetical protein